MQSQRSGQWPRNWEVNKLANPKINAYRGFQMKKG